MKKYIYIFLLIVGTTSCNDFLEKNPDNRTFLDDPDKVEEFLVSAYPYTGYQFTEFLTDNVTDLGLNYPWDYPDITIVLNQLYHWQTPDVLHWIDNPSDYWYACYEAIAYANYAIDAIDALVAKGTHTANAVASIRAEALMCRAYAHFMLVNIYGEHYDPATASTALGIPIVDKAERAANVKYTRHTVKEVYDFIEKDIEKAFPDIKNSTYSKPRWHFNREAAATFASRFYLYRGLDSDWNKVIEYANQALGSNSAALLRDYAALQAVSDYDQRKINYSRSENPCNFLIISTISFGSNYSASRYTMDESILLSKMRNITHPTEKTTAATRYLPGKIALWYGVSYPNRFIPKYHQYFRYSNINSSEGNPFVMYVVFSPEEALFNLAEACVMTNHFTGAVNTLNSYYSKRLENYDSKNDTVTEKSLLDRYKNNTVKLTPAYSVTEKQHSFLQCLTALRNAEFMYEGLRWFDIKRMHIQIEHKVYNKETLVLAPNDPRRVFELPGAVLSDGITGNFNPESGTPKHVSPVPYMSVMRPSEVVIQ
jgi:hypothetical protein